MCRLLVVQQAVQLCEQPRKGQILRSTETPWRGGRCLSSSEAPFRELVSGQGNQVRHEAANAAGAPAAACLLSWLQSVSLTVGNTSGSASLDDVLPSQTSFLCRSGIHVDDDLRNPQQRLEVPAVELGVGLGDRARLRGDLPKDIRDKGSASRPCLWTAVGHERRRLRGSQADNGSRLAERTVGRQRRRPRRVRGCPDHHGTGEALRGRLRGGLRAKSHPRHAGEVRSLEAHKGAGDRDGRVDSRRERCNRCAKSVLWVGLDGHGVRGKRLIPWRRLPAA